MPLKGQFTLPMHKGHERETGGDCFFLVADTNYFVNNAHATLLNNMNDLHKKSIIKAIIKGFRVFSHGLRSKPGFVPPLFRYLFIYLFSS